MEYSWFTLPSGILDSHNSTKLPKCGLSWPCWWQNAGGTLRIHFLGICGAILNRLAWEWRQQPTRMKSEPWHQINLESGTKTLQKLKKWLCAYWQYMLYKTNIKLTACHYVISMHFNSETDTYAKYICAVRYHHVVTEWRCCHVTLTWCSLMRIGPNM